MYIIGKFKFLSLMLAVKVLTPTLTARIKLKYIAKLSSSWLVQPSSAELRFALYLIITTHPPPPPE